MNYLRDYRVKKLMTQKELSKASGVCQVTISFIENNHCEPIHLTIMRLSEALGVPVEKLFPHEIPVHALTTLRTRKGWTQKDLSASSGVNEVTINFIENWRSEPTHRIQEKLARALGVPVKTLFPSPAKRK